MDPSVRGELRRLGLAFASDSDAGITRRRYGSGFAYFDPSGRRLRDTDILDRIAKLVIPPGWSDVWICPRHNGFLQATGRDARGRKQAIYHHDWRAHRDENKFGELYDFGLALPSIRTRIDRDLRRRGLPKERVLAAVVRLLEGTLIRIGNRQYVKENGSYGLTTLQLRHLEIGPARIRFRFRGKSGKFHDVSYRDRRLARTVRQIQELPGQSIFQFLDESGQPHEITSDDVNDYLREISSSDFTAKEFRTWAATVEAVRTLRDLYDGRDVLKADVTLMVKIIAARLGNTPSVCRSSYIHPLVFQLEPSPPWLSSPLPRARKGLHPIERLVIEQVLAPSTDAGRLAA